MCTIIKKEKKDLCVLFEDMIRFETILSVFVKAPEKIIYVEDRDGTFVGIITLGTFSRNFDHSSKWLNRGSVYISTKEKDIYAEAEKKFNKSIHEIPVLDAQKQLCCVLMSQNKNRKQNLSQETEQCLTQKREIVKQYLSENHYKNIAIWNSVLIKNSFEKAGSFFGIDVINIEEEYEKNYEKNQDVFLQIVEKFSLILTETESMARILKGIVYFYNIKIEVMSMQHFVENINRISDFQELFDFWKKHHVHCLFFASPKLSEIKNLTEYEKNKVEGEIRLNGDIDEKIEKYGEDFKRILGERANEEYLKKLADIPRIIEKNGLWKLEDFHSELVNTESGYRVTTEQPETYDNSIFIFGPCMVAGLPFVEDGETIASFLQKRINETNQKQKKYRVVNCGISSLTDRQLMRQVMYHSVSDGDMVVIIFRDMPDEYTLKFFQKHEVIVHNLSSLFERPHNYGDWFFDEPRHTCYRGNKVIADAVFKELIFDETKYVQHQAALRTLDVTEENEELTKYLAMLKQYSKKHESITSAGAIVMNANPFTLGHRYLVEQALKSCGFLYVFVVEEERSYFPFKTRLELVKRGVRDLKNVEVLPSGQFIISALTFPEYFKKDIEKDITINPSMDLETFGGKIAPILKISKRFVGKEPLDPITEQYNRSMEKILPDYGIEVIEIERKQNEKEVISASRVRQALQNGEWDKISAMVPKTTLEYLQNEKIKAGNKSPIGAIRQKRGCEGVENIILRPVLEQDLEMIMNWRMQPEITRYMNTDPVLTMEMQKDWFEKLQKDDTAYQWIIEVGGVPIGVTGITGIDRVNERCTRGIYIAVKEKSSLNLIVNIYSTQFDFIFYELKLNKIEVEVFKENRNVIKLNKMCGFKEEGCLCQHVKKNGIYHDIVLLGLSRQEWEEKKKNWNYEKVKIIV